MPRITIYTTFFLIFHIGCADFGDNKLNIATSANSQYAVKDIVKAFEKIHNINVNVIVGSSGKLSAQIKQGAPYDLFVAADLLYPQDLYETGYATDMPEVYAYGKLICWTLKAGLAPNISSFTNPAVKKIAIANPKLAPYGRYAQSVIEHFGILDSINDKLVYGENLSQTTQYIQKGVADIGITSISLVKKVNDDKGSWEELPEESYLPIAQSTIIINRSTHEYTKLFYDFLFSDDAQLILESYGFIVDLSK